MFFCFSFCVSSQNETNIWYFGWNAGLDFNSGNPIVLLDGALNTNEGCATISDTAGNLLFYTDGTTTYNRNHAIMQNGTELNGDPSSTHSALIVPKPGDTNIYYIFTVDFEARSEGLQYSEVDMSLDNGLGGITTNKNILLHTPTTEKLTAIKNSMNDEFWVVSHGWNSDEFLSYKVTTSGVNTTPVTSAIGSFVGGADVSISIGQIKISPDGSKIAVAREQGLSEVQLFDFDAATGIVSNPITLIDLPNNELVYGIEFSPNSEVLYVSITGNGIYQYDLEAGSPSAIIASEFLITPLPRPYASMQLATDGKIYVAKVGQFDIDVIDNPNTLGAGCNYQFEFLNLGGNQSRFGLPPFIQSFLIIEDIQFENVCFGDVTEFSLTDTVDTAVWNFGDPTTGVNNTSTQLTPTHIFSAPGTYQVSVTATIGGEVATSDKTIIIYEQPLATQPIDIEVCDVNNDGFASFNLSALDASILNGQDASIFEVVYFATMTDYNNNQAIANPSTYTNQTAYAQQTIIASVRNISNRVCEATTDFYIQVFDTPTVGQNIPDLRFCDDTSFGTDNDGIILFDLTQNETDILNGQSSTDVSVSYFSDAALTNQINNPANYQNTSSPQTIYVQVSNISNLSCNTQSSFEIEVYELPTVTPIVELRQCDDDLDGFSIFNLNEAINEITTNSINETITFHESLLEAQNNTNSITNSVSYTNQTVSTDMIWTRIENNNSCYRISQIDLIVSTTQIPNIYTRDFYECDDGVDITDGIATFNFSSVTAEVEALFPVGQQLIINYYSTQTDALSETNPIADITNYQNIGYPNTQDIFIRVDSALDNDCLGLGHHITLHVETVPVANPVTIGQECDDDGDGQFAFDTSMIEQTLLNGQTGVNVLYIDEVGNPLPSPLPNPFTTTSQTISVRVENTTSQDPDGACFDETTIDFVVEAAVIANPTSDIIDCDDDNDGMISFNTSTIEATVLGGQTGMIVTYFDEASNTLPSPLPNPFSSISQTITIRVENPLNSFCFDETTFNIIAIEQPELTPQENYAICEDQSIFIETDAGYDHYLWSTGETTRIIEVDTPGVYEVTATNTSNGVDCQDTQSITVVESTVATITNIETVDWTDNDNVITVFVEGNGDYEYSIDGINYQESNVFSNLPIDDYTVFVRDKNGCGIANEDVYLLYYPKYFTPNSDGYHDTWQIKNSQREPLNIVYIYDRYGKLLKQINPNNDGWDGTFNGQLMPTSDYWFVVNRQNGKQYKGHFSLVR